MDPLYFFICYLSFNVSLYYLYPFMDVVCSKYLVRYNHIEPKHKQTYFISNLLKGGILGFLSIYAYSILVNYFYYNLWDTHSIKYLGAVYATLDAVSIIKVDKMQLNTVIHHVIVQFLYMISLFALDFNVDTIARGVVIYAIFSTFAFLVNVYLALRLIVTNEIYKKKLAKMSSIVYRLSCFLNWSYQLYFIYSVDSYITTKIIYSSVLVSIIYDDIVLIDFLNKNS